jgi:hypothetical protein
MIASRDEAPPAAYPVPSFLLSKALNGIQLRCLCDGMYPKGIPMLEVNRPPMASTSGLSLVGNSRNCPAAAEERTPASNPKHSPSMLRATASS